MDSLHFAIEAQRRNPYARYRSAAVAVPGATPPLHQHERNALARAVELFSRRYRIATTQVCVRAFNSVMTPKQICGGKFGTVRARRLGSYLAARWPADLEIPAGAERFFQEVT